ncbi:MAG: ThuA domain-containing protein [Fibrobacterales bacterium]
MSIFSKNYILLLVILLSIIRCSTNLPPETDTHNNSSSDSISESSNSSSEERITLSLSSSTQSSPIESVTSSQYNYSSSLFSDISSNKSSRSSSQIDPPLSNTLSSETDVIISSVELTSSSEPLSSADLDLKWISLFNGEDLSNWVIKAHVTDVNKNYFKVENGSIVADAYDTDHDYVWLYSEKEYTDFHLKLKFQGDRGNYANSGVQVRSRYDNDDNGGWLNGPQIDIGFTGRNGSIWDETRNNQKWLSFDSTDTTPYWSDETPAWNDLEVIVKGLHIITIQNGDTITNYNGGGIFDDENHENLNVGTTGHIALQIHTHDKMQIRFKDVIIQDLTITPINILVFNKIAGFSHDAIDYMVSAIDDISNYRPWNITVTDNSDLFITGSLDTFDLVLWNNNCADDTLLTLDEQKVFEDYIHNGGGFAGFHGAAWSSWGPTYWDHAWVWFVDTLLGAREISLGGDKVFDKVLNGEADIHKDVFSDLTVMIHDSLVWDDEFYQMSQDPRGVTYDNLPDDGIEILTSATANVGHTDFDTGHPVSWRHTLRKGRMWYIGAGHNKWTIDDPTWRAHIIAGIEWAAGR